MSILRKREVREWLREVSHGRIYTVQKATSDQKTELQLESSDNLQSRQNLGVHLEDHWGQKEAAQILLEYYITNSWSYLIFPRLFLPLLLKLPDVGFVRI